VRNGGNLNVHRKALGRLKRDGLARRVDVSLKLRGGRRGPREFAHFLSDARKGEAIVRGARACGIKFKAKAKKDYGRVGLPGHHTRRRNDFYLAMILRAREINAEAGKTVVDVPVDDVWGESCPDFPLRGAKITRDEGGKLLTGFELQKAGYVDIEPDGRFLAEWPGQGFAGADLSCTYDVELELWTRRYAVMGKMDERAESYSRLLQQHHQAVNERRREVEKLTSCDAQTFFGLPEAFVPVLFHFKTDAVARNMRDRVFKSLEAGDGALAGVFDLQSRPEIGPRMGTGEDGRPKVVEPPRAGIGRFYLFAGLDRLEGNDPFGFAFWPLLKYPMHLEGVGGEGRVSLEAVAREREETDRKDMRKQTKEGQGS